MGNNPVGYIDPDGGFGIDFGNIGQLTGSAFADRALITLAGAAIGYGLDKLMGGDGWTGAAIGGGVALIGTFVPPFDTDLDISLKADYTVRVGNAVASVGLGASNHSNFYGTGKSGVELRASILGGFLDRHKNTITLGTNFFSGIGGMSEFKQQTGILNMSRGIFSISYENDGTPFPKLSLGDGYDRYSTAAVKIGIGQFSTGFNLFTGQEPAMWAMKTR